MHIYAATPSIDAINQKLPQVLTLSRRYPDARKPSLQQQLQDQRGISAIVLLLPHIGCANLRRVPNPELMVQRPDQIDKPLTVPGRLHPNQRRRWQSPVKSLGFARGVF